MLLKLLIYRGGIRSVGEKYCRGVDKLRDLSSVLSSLEVATPSLVYSYHSGRDARQSKINKYKLLRQSKKERFATENLLLIN